MYYDEKADAKLGGKVKDPIVKAVKWVKSRSQKEKGIMGCAGAAFVSSHQTTLQCRVLSQSCSDVHCNAALGKAYSGSDSTGPTSSLPLWRGVLS